MGKALEQQIGGSHYKEFVIQPIEFIIKNRFSFPQGNVIKYISRYNREGGKKLEDLLKAKHYIDLIIELENLVAKEQTVEEQVREGYLESMTEPREGLLPQKEIELDNDYPTAEELCGRLVGDTDERILEPKPL